MKKEKIILEYPLKATSKAILWNAISTSFGLEKWFADKVEFLKDKKVVFWWSRNDNRSATISVLRNDAYIRFVWEDEKELRTYFEIRMLKSDLTREYMLQITDFADVGEEEDLEELWNSQVDELKRVFGF